MQATWNKGRKETAEKYVLVILIQLHTVFITDSFNAVENNIPHNCIPLNKFTIISNQQLFHLKRIRKNASRPIVCNYVIGFLVIKVLNTNFTEPYNVESDVI